MVSLDFDIARSPALLRLSSLPVGEVLGRLGFLALVGIPTYILILSVYRIYFHPLSKYPGPKLAAATKTYRHWYQLRGQDAMHSLDLHNKYGPVVRYGPDHLIYISDTAWKDIYGHRVGGKKSFAKQRLPQVYPNHDSIIIADDANHTRQRRIFSNAFSDASLRKQEVMFQKYVDMLVTSLQGKIREEPERKLNMVDWLNFTTFDVMGDLTFGEPLGMLQQSSYVPWVKSIFQFIKTNSFIFVITEYPPISSLLKLLIPKSLRAARDDHIRFTEERVDRRVEKNVSQPDIWNLVLKQEGHKALERKEMYSNANIFMIAGTETTATLLSGLIYSLLKNPHIMDRLKAELDEAFPGGEGITSDKLQRLKYLHACLEETLRIYPPVPIALLRHAPAEGAPVDGEWVPGNTRVGVTQYAAYHSTTNFALPFEYHPERWLADNEDERFFKDNKGAFQPFSVGPRNCLGRNMAYYEMRLIAARLLMNFDMELCPESSSWTQQKQYGLWEKPPLMVKLRQRA